MFPKIIAWQSPPTAAELCAHPHTEHLIVCLPKRQRPNWHDHPNLQAALSCVQFDGVNVLTHALPRQTLWLIPKPHSAHLADFFGQRRIHWQTDALAQNPVADEKMWFRQPENTPVSHAIVVGAGIAGATTANELARRGVRVTVLESADRIAPAASGNRQGLLYAKIAPHPTPQTELLMSAYGYARHLLHNTLPENPAWGDTGVLHLNHNAAETQRNAQLAQHTWHQHLYRAVSPADASDLAGIVCEQGGLFWEQGCWLNPAALIHRLLQHPNIALKLRHPLLATEYDGQNWHVQTPHGGLIASHLVFCTGSGSLKTPFARTLPLQIIRGQTSVVAASPLSQSLKIALSGTSYFAPAWENCHTYGASFLPNNPDDSLQTQDEQHNRQALQQLNPTLFASLSFSGSLKNGHAALRCDAHDHLPVVGALGDAHAMRQVYAKLALDKHYRLHDPCPFHPNVYINTAHGSRGLTTAPLCSAHLAALMLGEPLPLSRRLQHALHPNRLVIKQIIRGKM